MCVYIYLLDIPSMTLFFPIVLFPHLFLDKHIHFLLSWQCFKFILIPHTHRKCVLCIRQPLVQS